MAAAILEFQLALLEDDDLVQPILARIAAGEPADRAWAAALEHEIADYAAGEDETFAARAGDLADLRARVNAATGSMGVALTSCTGPAAGKPTFEVGEDERWVWASTAGRGANASSSPARTRSPKR